MNPLIETAQTRRQMLAGTAAAAAAGLVALTEGCVREPVALARAPVPVKPPELKLYRVEGEDQIHECMWWSAESPEAAVRMAADLIRGRVLGPGLPWPSETLDTIEEWTFRVVSHSRTWCEKTMGWNGIRRHSERVTVTEVPADQTMEEFLLEVDVICVSTFVSDETQRTARELVAEGPGCVLALE